MQTRPEAIIMYCRQGCEDSELARSVLQGRGVPFIEIDIDADPDALALVRTVNNGYESTPTLVFPDGRILVEPTEQQLLRTLEEMGMLAVPKGGDA